MRKNRFLIFGVLLLISTSCRRNGVGGDADLSLEVVHHNAVITNATAYISFDAIEMPSNPESDFDLKVQGNADNNIIKVAGLRAGQYYIYVVGYDGGISQTVKGGVPLEIKWKERKSEMSITVPVTE